MSDKEEFNDEDFTHEEMDLKPKKNNRRIALIVALVIITNLGTAFIASRYWINVPILGDKGANIVAKPSKEDVEAFKKLFLVKDKLEEYYYGEIDVDKLVEGAIKGMASGVGDPYTSYMNEEEFEKWNSDTGGVYVGLGIQVGVIENEIVITAPFDGSPAAKAGILSGDKILGINGESMAGSDLEKAVAIMKGKKGESVNLTLFRESKGQFNLDVTREEVTMVTVKSEIIEENLGYIRVTSFDENTAENFNKKLNNLSKDGMKGLILDLRGNPGGLVKECVKLASNFIPKDETIVYTIDKDDKKSVYKSVGGEFYDLPLVVLTDGGTASASEIVSGALRDYNKAIIVGEKTFGKGIVQNIIYRPKDGFGDGTALKLTVSGYYTPKGNNIHKKGIEPDVVVEIPDDIKEQPYDKNIDPQYKKALEVIKDKIK
ncbi:S41 family peptidase [Clostridium sp.]|uniref:S41 family peptidase n=1 Tax=Clostridium sp. TaxID=1506 RepID=UPI003217F813